MVKIRLCPKCRKPTLRNATNVSGWLTPQLFQCTKCDNIGYFHLEIDPNDYKIVDDNILFDKEKDLE